MKTFFFFISMPADVTYLKMNKYLVNKTYLLFALNVEIIKDIRKNFLIFFVAQCSFKQEKYPKSTYKIS